MFSISRKSPNKEGAIFAIQRLYKGNLSARPYVAKNTKEELDELLNIFGYKISEKNIEKMFRSFKAKLQRQVDQNRVTGNATYRFKTQNPDRNVTLPNGLVSKGAPAIVYREGSYISRIFYRNSLAKEGDFTIFIGSGSADANALKSGQSLQGGRTRRFVSYGAIIDENLPNRKPYVVTETRRVFMPYKSGARWVTLKAGTIVNPPAVNPVNSLRAWNEVVAEFRNDLIEKK